MDDPLAVVINNTKISAFDFNVMEQNITVFQEFYRTSVVTVAMFLNCVVILVVGNSRQLRYPRHVFWAGISLFECLFLVQVALEMYIILTKDPIACRFYVFICTVDYSTTYHCLSL